MCELHSQALPTPLATSHRRTRERSGLIELERVIYPLVHGYPRPLVAKQDGELRGEAKHQAVVRVKLWTPKRPQGGLDINNRKLPISWVYKSSTEVKGMSSSMYTRLRAVAHHLYPKLRAAKMSTQSAVHNTNIACCSIPPVTSHYTPKGKYKSYAGFTKVGSRLPVQSQVVDHSCSASATQVYVAGPDKPGKVALVCVYDIFG